MKTLTATLYIIFLATGGFAASVTWDYSGYRPDWTPHRIIRMPEWVIKEGVDLSVLKEISKLHEGASEITIDEGGSRVNVHLKPPKFKRHFLRRKSETEK